jgi:DNA-directed RNA polymerase subunit RPC12/RpoP
MDAGCPLPVFLGCANRFSWLFLFKRPRSAKNPSITHYHPHTFSGSVGPKDWGFGFQFLSRAATLFRRFWPVKIGSSHLLFYSVEHKSRLVNRKFMENSLNLLLVLVGVALLLASIALVLAASCLYRLIQQRPPSFSWTVSNASSATGQTAIVTPLEVPRTRRTKKDKPAEKKPYTCIRCHHCLPSMPHHGVVHEEKEYVVYTCENCGKETQLPAPSAENTSDQGV